MRKHTIGALFFFYLSTAAFAGASSGNGNVSWTANQSASLASVMDTAATVLSWFLTFSGKSNPVGPASDALNIADSFADGAKSFSEAVPEFDDALDFSLSIVVGDDQPVRSKQDLSDIQRATREQLGQQHLSDFGLSRSTIDKAVEASIEAQGLKAY